MNWNCCDDYAVQKAPKSNLPFLCTSAVLFWIFNYLFIASFGMGANLTVMFLNFISSMKQKYEKSQLSLKQTSWG